MKSPQDLHKEIAELTAMVQALNLQVDNQHELIHSLSQNNGKLRQENETLKETLKRRSYKSKPCTCETKKETGKPPVFRAKYYKR